MNKNINFRACLGNNLIGYDELSYVKDSILHKNLFRYSKKSSFSSKMEKIFLKYFSVKHALLLVNGTSSLRCALMSLNPIPGDHVVVPGLTFVATVNSVLSSGLIPCIVDVDKSGHLSPHALSHYLEKCSKKPLAVIVAHLDGSGANIQDILKICDYYSIPLIEDVAQSFGVKKFSKYLGTFGLFGCFSFQQNKILSSGEGGLLITNSINHFNKAIRFSDHGCERPDRYFPSWDEYSFFGENYKITEICSAILLAQLKKFDLIKDLVTENYKILTSFFLKKNIIFFQRSETDIPISLWIESEDIKEKFNRNNLPYLAWEGWNMVNHPIIKRRQSPYKNNFPWNLEDYINSKERSDLELNSYFNTHQISFNRISIPIPVSKSDLNHLITKFDKVF